MPINPKLKAHGTKLRRRAAHDLGEFGSHPEHRAMMLELYRRAETELRKQKKTPPAKGPATKPAVDTRRLLHELQVHQVELEMQNAELQESRDRTEVLLEKYADLYDFAPVGYFTLDTTGTIQLVNLTGTHLVRIERSRLVGQPFARLVCADQRPAFNIFLKQVFAERIKQSGDFDLLCPGQPPRSVNIEAQQLLNGQECRAVVVDISERKQIADKVRVSEVRYRRLFEAAHDGVLLINPSTRKITDANPFMTKLLGYPREQLIGKELFEIGLLKDEAASQEMFEKLKRKHEVRYEDLPLEGKAGRHQEVEVVANLYQESGHAVIQCNIRDITERKHAEEVLRRSEALFSALIEHAPFGVYVVDAGFRLQQVNRRARPIFKNVRPLIGRDFSEVHHILWPKQVSDPIVKRFRHTLKTGQPYQAPEFSARRRDTGAKEYYEWQIQRITLPSGEHGVVAFFNDITERKHAEAIRRRIEVLAASNAKLEKEIVQRQAVEKSLKQSEQHQRRLLEESRRMQEELRYLSRQMLQVQEDERKRISRELHDVIAQTLTGINIRLSTLKKEAGHNPVDFNRSIARTQLLVGHAIDVIHQFARELRPALLDDLGLVPALHSILKNFTEQTGVRTRLTTYAGIEELDTAKRTVLFRVAQEALTNVARHAHASLVEVSIEKSPQFICMKLKNDGKSFDVPSVLQAKGSKRLGLLGMRERLEMIGGLFQIESAPGQGTTITASITHGKNVRGRKR